MNGAMKRSVLLVVRGRSIRVTVEPRMRSASCQVSLVNLARDCIFVSLAQTQAWPCCAQFPRSCSPLWKVVCDDVFPKLRELAVFGGVCSSACREADLGI